MKKLVTETMLRKELLKTSISEYVLPKGTILSPAAMDFLHYRKIKVVFQDSEPRIRPCNLNQNIKEKNFIDYETKETYAKKPEHMTHLHGNSLVTKNHPRIVFRGMLDSLEAEIVLAQSLIAMHKGRGKLLADLDNILNACALMMRSDVLELPYENDNLLGMSPEEIHERSHNPMKYYNIQQLLMPEYSMGFEHALINKIRAMIRQTEVAAVNAFYENNICTRIDLVMGLNRLSSCMHLIACMYLAGKYNDCQSKENIF